MELNQSDTRTVLLLAALHCFSEFGFDRTTMRMIADRAKRHVSLLSHHFKNKEGLYTEVFLFSVQSLPQASKHGLPIDGLVPRDRSEALRLLREQIHNTYLDASPEAFQEKPLLASVAKLWLLEMRSPKEFLVPILKKFTTPFSLTIKRCIQKLRPDLNEAEVTFIAASIVGMVVSHGFLHGFNSVTWGRSPSLGNPFQSAECLMDLCLHGLLRHDGPEVERSS